MGADCGTGDARRTNTGRLGEWRPRAAEPPGRQRIARKPTNRCPVRDRRARIQPVFLFEPVFATHPANPGPLPPRADGGHPAVKTQRGSILPLVLAAVAVLAAPARADHHLMQNEQVIAGVNGDVTAQAVQLRMRAGFQNLMSHGRLRAWDAAGANPVMVIDFLTDVPNQGVGVRVLVLSAGMVPKLD